MIVSVERRFQPAYGMNTGESKSESRGRLLPCDGTQTVVFDSLGLRTLRSWSTTSL
jgi:hypothetical protein